jgi:hypothetical protein
MSVSHFTVVRAVVRETGMMTNDAVFVFRTLDGRAAFDSLVERRIVRSAP